MIVAQQKPLADIQRMVAPYERLMLLGCGTCTTVCLAGGEREVTTLAALLRLSGPARTVIEATIKRQCDEEFLPAIAREAAQCDAILSMGCGVGVQFVADYFDGKPVLPALNTKFMGSNERTGVWLERCLGCGDCKLDLFGGICPLTRCSKGILNGPCGGSVEGMCEVDPQRIECGWQMIYDRMAALGRLDELSQVMPPRDWSTTHDGGPRRAAREDWSGWEQ